MPALQRFKITERQPTQDYFTLLVKQNIDTSAAQKLFQGLFKKMNIEDEKATIEAKEILSSFEIADYGEYKVIQSSVWIKQLRYNRTGKTAQMNQSTSYLIELIK